jgi:hypothetical protein
MRQKPSTRDVENSRAHQLLEDLNISFLHVARASWAILVSPAYLEQVLIDLPGTGRYSKSSVAFYKCLRVEQKTYERTLCGG